MISHALIGGREIGVTVDEIPFGVDAAVDVRITRMVIEVGALAIEQRVSTVSGQKPFRRPHQPASSSARTWSRT
jgi:hypothetical protein